jgi:hypothetical protein
MPDTGAEVPNKDIVKGYVLDKEMFIEVSKEELEEVALESTRTTSLSESRAETHPSACIIDRYDLGQPRADLVRKIRDANIVICRA